MNDPRAGLPGPWHDGAWQGASSFEAPRPAPALRPPPRRPAAGRLALWVGIGVVLAVSALATLLVISLSTGPIGSLVGLLLAIVPVLPVAACLLWLDRYEDEPRPLLAFCFAWGATAAVIISLFFSITSMVVIAGAGGQDWLGAVVVAPIVEESAKSLAVLGILLIRRSQLNGIVDGIVYAGLSALGFAFAENILYLGQSFLEGGLPAAVVTFLVRCVMGPFAHPMFTAAFGVGVGLAVRAREPFMKVAHPLIGLLCAMCLHSLWNGLGMLGGEGAWFLGYLVVQVPIFVVVVVFAVKVRRREATLIATNLQVYARAGWITGEELAMLVDPGRRRQARAWAHRTAGTSGRRSMREFQHLAGELSFLREQIATQSAPAGAATTEIGLLNDLWQLRLGFQPLR